MYNYNGNNEERDGEGFPWRDVIIKVLLIFLLVFLLIWLVPWPKEQKEVNLDPLYNQIYLDNIERMHNAAKNYYTVDRLPKKVGDKVTMTLGEMLNKKLLVEFKDSEGNTCDPNKSYVEVTKYDSEYALITYLSCNKQQDQMIEYLGCHNLCPLNECPTVDIIKPGDNGGNNNKPNPTPDPKPEPQPQKKYKYEYKRSASIVYSAWSDWSNKLAIKSGQTITFGLSSDKLTEYRSAGTQQLLLGYKVTYDKDKPLFRTTYDNLIGYYTLRVCEEYKYVVTTDKKVLQVGGWVAVGKPQPYKVSPSDNLSAGIKYELIDTDDPRCDATCKYSTTNYYQKYTRTTTSVGTTDSVKVTCARYETDRVPVYGQHITFEGYEKIKTPYYSTVKLYQKRTRTVKSKVTEDYQWSTSSNDKTLLSKGYRLTGKRVQI